MRTRFFFIYLRKNFLAEYVPGHRLILRLLLN
jgi:hypothetical protein